MKDKIFAEFISKILKDCKNKDHIKQIFAKNISTSVAEFILYLYFMDREYKPVKLGGYAKFNVDSISSKFDRTEMIEMGLLVDNNLFCKVISVAWSNEDDVYATTMTVEILTSENYNLKIVEKNISTIELTPIDMKDIPYFNKEHIKNIEKIKECHQNSE